MTFDVTNKFDGKLNEDKVIAALKQSAQSGVARPDNYVETGAKPKELFGKIIELPRK